MQWSNCPNEKLEKKKKSLWNYKVFIKCVCASQTSEKSPTSAFFSSEGKEPSTGVWPRPWFQFNYSANPRTPHHLTVCWLHGIKALALILYVENLVIFPLHKCWTSQQSTSVNNPPRRTRRGADELRVRRKAAKRFVGVHIRAELTFFSPPLALAWDTQHSKPVLPLGVRLLSAAIKRQTV